MKLSVVGIREVAKRSGVSTATVARVLRGGDQVSPELTARVRTAIDDLGYVPNAVARSLARGRTNLVGLVIPDISNPFFSELARGLEDAAVGHGFHVLIGSSDLKIGREDELVAAFEARTVDAVVITPTTSEDAGLSRLRRRGVPVVFADRHLPEVPAPAVLVDNETAVRRAVDYLFDMGHRDIAMLSGPPRFETAEARVRGFLSGYRARRRRPREGYVQQGHLGVEGGYKAMDALMNNVRRPTACISFNNLLTVGALGALREHQVKMPGQMSLISFDDMSLFPFVDPPITAIAQPAYEMGVMAGRLVFELLSGQHPANEPVILQTEFRIRGSCAPPVRS